MAQEPHPSFLGRVVREPLVHFLVLGAVIFGISALNPDDRLPEDPETIVVSEGQIDQLIEIWTRTRMRPPSQGELRGLIDAHVREEILYREALALGLDRDDTIVRRRLAQKMEFVAEGLATVAEPTDEQLLALLEGEPERFQTPAQVSFQQVYVRADERGDSATAHAEALLGQLQGTDPAAIDPSRLGDHLLLDFEHRDVPLERVERLFGAGFAASLETLERDVWSGPVESGYGLHLVRVLGYVGPRAPALADVRDHVRREWLARQRNAAEDELIRSLREKYTVVIETSELETGSGAQDGERLP
jgi:hypothetical protein